MLPVLIWSVAPTNSVVAPLSVAEGTEPFMHKRFSSDSMRGADADGLQCLRLRIDFPRYSFSGLALARFHWINLMSNTAVELSTGKHCRALHPADYRTGHRRLGRGGNSGVCWCVWRIRRISSTPRRSCGSVPLR